MTFSKQEVINQDLQKAIAEHEGIRNSLYVDTAKNLTIGIGNNFQNIENFMELKLVDITTGHELNTDEKTHLYNSIQTAIANKTFNAAEFANIQLSEKDINSKFEEQLNSSYRELERKISDFSSLPISVQQALIDMQFNMGSRKFSERYWPNLFNAIRERDWQKAAQESHRIGIQESRQTWTRNKFLDAI